MKVIATIEARMTSNRLPGKVLMKYGEKTNLEHIVSRIKRSKFVDEVVVATTTNDTDDPIVELCESIGCKYFRGSENDVLLRVLEAAKSVNGDLIVEITGDCPVIDWNHIDHLVQMYFDSNADYAANVIVRTFPRGFDTQVFSVNTLEKVNELTQNPVDHEHVSLFIYTHPDIFKLVNWEAPRALNHPEIEITLDTWEDYELISEIYDALYVEKTEFTAEDVVSYILNNKKLYERAQGRHRKNAFEEQKSWLEREREAGNV